MTFHCLKVEKLHYVHTHVCRLLLWLVDWPNESTKCPKIERMPAVICQRPSLWLQMPCFVWSAVIKILKESRLQGYRAEKRGNSSHWRSFIPRIGDRSAQYNDLKHWFILTFILLLLISLHDIMIFVLFCLYFLVE